MKIGINITWMRPGETGGMEGYLRELLHHLAQIDQQNDYVVVMAPMNHKTFCLPKQRWKKILYPGPDNNPISFKYVLPNTSENRSSFYQTARKCYRWVQYRLFSTWRGKLADLIKEEQLDVWFCPFMFALPIEADVPIVNTIPDIQHEFFPDFFSEDDLALRILGYQYSCSTATATLGISDHTIKELHQEYGLHPSKLFSTPLALSSSFKALCQNIDHHVEQVRVKFRINRDYLYFPANGWPHKNHRNLIKAFHSFRQKGYDFDLILTGAQLDLLEKLSDLLAAYDLQKYVRHLGYVAQEDVVGLYKGAKMLVFPSLSEGFGLTLLEAMYVGTPIVCSQIGNLPFVGGNAVKYCDPRDIESITDAIWQVATDEEFRCRLIALGREQVKKFNYSETAKKTLDIFERIHRKELLPPQLPPVRPLLPHNWLDRGCSRWYFHSNSLKEIHVQVCQNLELAESREERIKILLNDVQLIESKINPTPHHDFCMIPATKSINGFYKLEIKASPYVTLPDEQNFSVKVMAVEIIEDDGKRTKLI